jgi:inner membrane protein involved in colicin E2 resistance
MQESIVVTGLIIFNFVLLALAAATGFLDVDVVFALTLLLLAAIAALVSIDRQ